MVLLATCRRKGLESVCLLILYVVLLYGCSVTPLIIHEQLGDLGRFEFREASEGRDGVVIAAPHGKTDRGSDKIAMAISSRTRAGLVMAYGFRAKRLSVNRPIVRSSPLYFWSSDPVKRGSVFTEYRKILQTAAKGKVELYIGIHRGTEVGLEDRIEVASSGLSFEEAQALKDAYVKIRDQLTEGKGDRKLALVIEPLDRISWRTLDVKHHGILLFARRGLNLRIPNLGGLAETRYTRILSQWTEEAIRLLQEPSPGVPRTHVRLHNLGRLEWIPSRNGPRGVVIGAPHGSFDEYTAEVVKRLSQYTGISTVIAKGFTPAEVGGWRINVNRPTERAFTPDDREEYSRTAAEIYRMYKGLVLKASGGELILYVDIHRYDTGRKIQVATLGITRDEARAVKRLYHQIRDRVLQQNSGVPSVDLLIEPVDEIEIKALPAKSQGILRLANKSLHIELPAHGALSTVERREAYTSILVELFRESLSLLVGGWDRGIRQKDFTAKGVRK